MRNVLSRCGGILIKWDEVVKRFDEPVWFGVDHKLIEITSTS